MGFADYADHAGREYESWLREGRGEKKGPQIWPEGWYVGRIRSAIDRHTPRSGRGEGVKITFELQNEDGQRKTLTKVFCYEHENPQTVAIALRHLGHFAAISRQKDPFDWEGLKLDVKLRPPKHVRNGEWVNDNEIVAYDERGGRTETDEAAAERERREEHERRERRGAQPSYQRPRVRTPQPERKQEPGPPPPPPPPEPDPFTEDEDSPF